MIHDYIGWVVAALAIGMVAWPILHIIPSPAQKKQIAFRSKARELGIEVQIRQPTLPPELDNQYQPLRLSVGYFLVDHDSRLDKSYTALRSQNDDNEWFWLGARPHIEQMPHLLSAYRQLPRYVQAVEQHGAGSTLFWREHGDISGIETIHENLTNLNKLINNKP